MVKNFIQWKRGSAYFRRRVPTPLTDIIGKVEWLSALGTKDRDVARQRSRMLEQETDEQIARAMRSLNGEALNREEIVAASLTHFERETAYNRHRIGEVDNSDEAVLDRLSEALSSARTLEELVGELDDHTPSPLEEIATRRVQLRSLLKMASAGEITLLQPFADAVFEAKGLPLDREREDYKELCRELLQKQIAAVREGIVTLAQADVGAKESQPRQVLIPVARKAQIEELREEAGQTPLELYDRFARDSKGVRGRSMLVTVRAALELLQQVTKTRATAEITARDIAILHDLISECPAKYRARLKVESMAVAIERNKELPSPFPVNTRATVAKHISALRTFFKWALSRRFALLNPVIGVSVEGGSSPATERQSFAADELQMLFDRKVFQVASERRDHRFWLPRLALYTGARLAELCQLGVADLRERDGVA